MLTVGAYSKYTLYDNKKLAQLADSDVLCYSPKVEETVPEEFREEIMQQVSVLYPNTDLSNIKLRYYGKLSNGAMLINHYNITQSADILAAKPPTQYISSSDSNLIFGYRFDSYKDVINLYFNGKIYSISEAGRVITFTDELLFELSKSVKSYLMIISWAENNRTDSVVCDIDGDDRITIGDVTMIQKIISGKFIPSECCIQNVDVNNDGIVDITDATELQLQLAQ